MKSVLSKMPLIPKISTTPLISNILSSLSVRMNKQGERGERSEKIDDKSVSNTMLLTEKICDMNDYQEIINILHNMTDTEKSDCDRVWVYCVKNNKLNTLRALLDERIFRLEVSMVDKYVAAMDLGSNFILKDFIGLENLLVESTGKTLLDSFWYEQDLTECLISMIIFRSYLVGQQRIHDIWISRSFNLQHVPTSRLNSINYRGNEYYQNLFFFYGYNDPILTVEIENILRYELCQFHINLIRSDEQPEWNKNSLEVTIINDTLWSKEYRSLIIERIRYYITAYMDNLHECRKLLHTVLCARLFKIQNKKELDNINISELCKKWNEESEKNPIRLTISQFKLIKN